MFTGLEHEKKDKVKVPQRNEMLRLYCTGPGLVSKNEEYNLEKKIYLTQGFQLRPATGNFR